MFSTLTTAYLFFGGVGGGLLTVLSALELANAQRRFSRVDRERARTLADGRAHAADCLGWSDADAPRADGLVGTSARDRRIRFARSPAIPDAFFAWAWALCLGALAVGVVCLLADLGRPDRVLQLLLSPAPSVMTVGAYSLAVALGCAALFFGASAFDGGLRRPGVARALACVGLAAGVVVALYTGVLLQSLASVLLWQTLLLPALFCASSLSCGVACALLAACFADAHGEVDCLLRRLAAADSLLIVLEVLCLTAYAVWAVDASGVEASVRALATGRLSLALWGGVVLCGLLLPFVLEGAVRRGVTGRRTALLCAALLVLAGGLSLRFVAVGAGGFDVTQMSDAVFGMALREGALL